jgi:hypothetical protein
MARGLSKATDGAHFMVKSKLVALGIQAASVVLPGFRLHHTRTGFEAALRACVERSRVA